MPVNQMVARSSPIRGAVLTGANHSAPLVNATRRPELPSAKIQPISSAGNVRAEVHGPPNHRVFALFASFGMESDGDLAGAAIVVDAGDSGTHRLVWSIRDLPRSVPDQSR